MLSCGGLKATNWKRRLRLPEDVSLLPALCSISLQNYTVALKKGPALSLNTVLCCLGARKLDHDTKVRSLKLSLPFRRVKCPGHPDLTGNLELRIIHYPAKVAFIKFRWSAVAGSLET